MNNLSEMSPLEAQHVARDVIVYCSNHSVALCPAPMASSLLTLTRTAITTAIMTRTHYKSWNGKDKVIRGESDNIKLYKVESSWNVMAHGDAREGKWRGNWRMQWVASTLHTTSEHGVSSITTADAHTSAASSRLNWRRLRRFKWTRPFRRKTKYGFCACAITFQLASIFMRTYKRKR